MHQWTPLPQEDELYQEAEPVVASGVTAALQMAMRKGFVEEDEDIKMKRKRDASCFVSVIVNGASYCNVIYYSSLSIMNCKLCIDKISSCGYCVDCVYTDKRIGDYSTLSEDQW